MPSIQRSIVECAEIENRVFDPVPGPFAGFITASVMGVALWGAIGLCLWRLWS